MDPHYPQETKDNCDEYYETYNTKNFYLLDIKDMRSQFSLGIGIFGSHQFNEFLEDAKWFSNNYKNVIDFDNKSK